jgi:hypothetical protein
VLRLDVENIRSAVLEMEHKYRMIYITSAVKEISGINLFLKFTYKAAMSTLDVRKHQLHAPTAVLPRKRPPVRIQGGAGGPQFQCVYGDKEKNCTSPLT